MLDRLISVGPQYFVDNKAMASLYPEGPEWVRLPFDQAAAWSTSLDVPWGVGGYRASEHALIEPLLAIHLISESQSVEEVDSLGSLGTRYRVVADFTEAARKSPAGISDRLALFGQLKWTRGLDNGLAPTAIEIDHDGFIRSIRIPSDEVPAPLSYTVRFLGFGGVMSIERPPPELTADWNPRLHSRVKGLTHADVRIWALQTAATTCESELELAGSLQAMASEWEVEDSFGTKAALIKAIASKYVDRYYRGTISDEPFRPQDLAQVTTQRCTRGILRGLRG
jgi:hypothetical protein